MRTGFRGAVLAKDNQMVLLPLNKDESHLPAEWKKEAKTNRIEWEESRENKLKLNFY